MSALELLISLISPSRATMSEMTCGSALFALTEMKRPPIHQKRQWVLLCIIVSLALFMVHQTVVKPDATFSIGAKSHYGSVDNKWRPRKAIVYRHDVGVASLGNQIKVELKERDFELNAEEKRNSKEKEEVKLKAEEKLELKDKNFEPRRRKLNEERGRKWGDSNEDQRLRNYEEEEREHDVKRAEILLSRDEQLSARPGHCNLNDGDWEYDEADPLYTNETCSIIQDNLNCLLNGRPDRKYLHWRWKPRACDLPQFNAKKFLSIVKSKTVGFVGDSIARNQMMSLVCLLSQAEKPVTIYNSFYYKKFIFERHQVTVMVVWAPYLVRNSTTPVQVEGVEIPNILYMDELEPVWTSELDEIDIVTVSIGQWYFMPTLYVRANGTETLACSMCSESKTPNESDIRIALQMFGASLRAGLERIATSEKAQTVVLTTYSPQHYEDPRGPTGRCERKEPITPEHASEYGWLNDEMRDVVLDEFTRVLDLQGDGYGKSSVSFELIDITNVMLLRADGHPGPYRQPYPYAHINRSEWVRNDCLHWCLPGPVDTWNQMLFQILRRYS